MIQEGLSQSKQVPLETILVFFKLLFAVDYNLQLLVTRYFEESIGMNVLRVQLVSKSQSNQRAGRAGREFDGSVYRLYTRKDYEQMEEFPPPEIIRSNLSRIILLAAVSLGISNFKDFPLPDRPTNKVSETLPTATNHPSIVKVERIN